MNMILYGIPLGLLISPIPIASGSYSMLNSLSQREYRALASSAKDCTVGYIAKLSPHEEKTLRGLQREGMITALNSGRIECMKILLNEQHIKLPDTYFY